MVTANEPKGPDPSRAKYRRYRCTLCGWTGKESEMDADASCNGDGWCNTVCPKCRTWQDLDAYEALT